MRSPGSSLPPVVTDGERRLLVALAHLDGFGPARLRATIAVGVGVAWERVTAGREPDGSTSTASGRWSAEIRRLDPDHLWDRHAAAEVAVTVPGDEGHPATPGDPDAAPLLFWRGPTAPGGPFDRGDAPRASVAIVGTRRATRYGVEVASDLGRRLAGAGIEVVSGLALGIDAAAHAGVVSDGGSAPLAVVAGGLDVVYPTRNRELWRAVERSGAVVSEYPLGVRPERWRFPARNRVLVGLSDLVVVVESHARGGSLITAGLAGERGVPVMAVPGPVTSAASAGTNALLADGCAPCLGVDDVLVALGLSSPGSSASAHDDGTTSDLAASLDPETRAVFDGLGVEGSSVGDLVEVLGLPMGLVSLALVRLQESGLVSAEHGRFARALGRVR